MHRGGDMKRTGILKAMRLCREYAEMSDEKREKLRNDRFREIVSFAKSKSPFYSRLYRNVPDDFRLEDLPATDKKTLMNHWNDWVTDRDLTLEEVREFMENPDNIGRKLKNKYLVFTTSGSTGNPLVAICDPDVNNIMGGINVCRSFARKEDLIAFIKRGGRSIGVFADGGFYLGNSSIRSRLISMPWKKKQLAVSSALYPVSEIVRQLNVFQPAMLGGYPSNLELLIEEAEEGRLHISPVLIMTGGEYLSDNLRQKLSDTFHCYVQTSYSCTEGGTVACECRYRHFHINDDWILVEPVDQDGNPVPDGILSDKIYLTNLFNYTQPYIRYEVTDRVIMHHEGCPCGNRSPWIELEGRTDDVISFSEEGRTIRIAPLSVYAVLKEVHEIRRFQVLAYPGSKVLLRIEEQEGADRSGAFEKAAVSLRNYLDSQGVHHAEILPDEELPKQDEGSGKFKHIINMQKEREE